MAPGPLAPTLNPQIVMVAHLYHFDMLPQPKYKAYFCCLVSHINIHLISHISLNSHEITNLPQISNQVP